MLYRNVEKPKNFTKENIQEKDISETLVRKTTISDFMISTHIIGIIIYSSI